MTLEQLRAALKAKSAEMQALIDKDAPTSDDLSKINEMIKEIEEIEANIATLERAAATLARTTKAADAPIATIDGQSRTIAADPAEKLDHNVKAGLICMAIANSQMIFRETYEHVSPMQILRDNGFERFANDVVKFRERRAELHRTLNASTASQGGILVPDSMSNEIIELLYPETIFLQGNPRRVDMPNGTFSQPGAATGSSASYRKEGARIVTTEPSFNAIEMSVKFLGAIVPMTRQMIQFSIAGARAWVETDLRTAMSQRMDSGGLFGAGTQGEPLGIFNRPGFITVPITGTNTATLAQIDLFITNMKLAFTSRQIRNKSRWRWIMSERTQSYIGNKRVGDNDGDYAYPEIRGSSPTLDGIPVLVSTKIPDNLGGGSDESFIALVNFDDVYFGQQEGLMMATSNEATIYHNGEWVSAFQNDLVFLRATHAHDVATRRNEAVVYSPAVRWGAP